MSIYRLEALHLLREGLDAAGLPSRTAVLLEQARLVAAGCEAANLLPADLDDVRGAYDKRFAADPLQPRSSDAVGALPPK